MNKRIKKKKQAQKITLEQAIDRLGEEMERTEKTMGFLETSDIGANYRWQIKYYEGQQEKTLAQGEKTYTPRYKRNKGWK